MKNFNDYLNAAGKLKDYPQPVYTYAAYKSGIVSFHSSKSDALSISTNIEKIETDESKVRRKDVNDHNIQVERSAAEAWLNDLRYGFLDMDDRMFSVIYSEAYDQAHSGGYDEVAATFYNLADFANKILDAERHK